MDGVFGAEVVIRVSTAQKNTPRLLLREQPGPSSFYISTGVSDRTGPKNIPQGGREVVRRLIVNWRPVRFPTCLRTVAMVVVFSRAMDWKNKLYFGDNLNILRDCVADASIDLIYLDPPFNSNANYNVLFKEKSGEESAAQITAFEDTWQWSLEAEAVYKEIVTSEPRQA